MKQDQPVDVVSIALPPRKQMSSVIRFATTAVASRTGLTLDQADDLNTALDEISRMFITGSGTAGTDLCVRYFIFPDRLEIVAYGVPKNIMDSADKLNRYSRFILESVSDQVEEQADPRGGYNVKIVKFLAT